MSERTISELMEQIENAIVICGPWIVSKRVEDYAVEVLEIDKKTIFVDDDGCIYTDTRTRESDGDIVEFVASEYEEFIEWCLENR